MSSNSNQRAVVPFSSENLEAENVETASARQPPRLPSNLQGVLRFSIEAGEPGNFENAIPPQHEPMDPERLAFLQNALKSMSDGIEQVKEALEILTRIDEIGPEGDISTHEDALDVIAEYVANIDLARDFYKIGGFNIIRPLLSFSRASIRWRAATVYAECMQNNPFCQIKVLGEMGHLEKLVKMTDSDPDNIVRIKALYAVSSIVRGNSLGLKQFTLADGFSVIMRAMQCDDEKLMIKCSFFLRSICSSNPEVKGQLVEMGFVEQLVGLIVSQEFSRKTEFLLSALNSLVQEHNDSINKCRRSEFGLQYYLENIIDNYKDKEDFLEAVVCANELLTAIAFPETSEK